MFSAKNLVFVSSWNNYQFPDWGTKNYYAWGKNDSYQHGDGTSADKSSPIQLNLWSYVACGNAGKHCLALDSTGSMFGWGANLYTQVRAKTNVSEDIIPVATQPISISPEGVVQGATDYWLKVACGGYHSLAINSSGTLWGWGLNNYGQAGSNFGQPSGDGSYPHVPSPQLIGTGSWIHISCGLHHSFAIKSDRTLWGWGDSSAGQVKGISFLTSPTQVDTSFGGVSFDNLRDVSCGWYHTAAIKMDGSLWTWGRNNNGQLANGLTNNNAVGRSVPGIVGSSYDWKSVSCGAEHCAAIKNDGTLWTWGRGSERQLGLGSTVQGATTPTKVGTDTWKSVSCGAYFTAAIRSDDTLWTWGHNIWDQLGLGPSYASIDTVSSPTQVPSFGIAWDHISCSDNFMVALGHNVSLVSFQKKYNPPEPKKESGISRIMSFFGLR